MNNFIFDLVTQEGFWGISESEFEDKLKEYQDIISTEINNSKELTEYLENWIKEHNFSNLDNTIFDYDLEKGYIEKKAVYTVDNKCYEILYYYDYCGEHELLEEPIEVYPVEKIVTEYIPVEDD